MDELFRDEGMTPRAGKRLVWILLLTAGAGLLLLLRFSDRLVEWLWLKQLGYESVFWRILVIQLAMFAGAFLVAGLYCLVNFRLGLRYILPLQLRGKEIQVYGDTRLAITPGRSNRLLALLAVFIGFLFGVAFFENWETFLRFGWAAAYGRSDPIYQRDIGFYLFKLPFYDLLQNSAAILTFVVFAVVLALNFLFVEDKSELLPRIRQRGFLHTSLCLLLFLLAWAWGYYLDRFELLFSSGGVVYGAGYTDLHVVRTGLWVMLAASLVLAGLIIMDALFKRPLITVLGLGAYVVAGLVVLKILPGLIQTFVVEPNELEKETPYLRHNIELTRLAYGLDRIAERDYPALSDLSFAEVRQNEQTLRNVRLWDWRPLLQTYRQMQEIRLYYRFYEVDVERYHLAGDDYRQVMAAARELSETLPARADTWVNRTLQFTHGYGIVMSLASQKGEGGVPEYLIKNLPPVSTAGLEVENPAIYYGENLPAYKIVNTQIKELDYPKGDQNVYTSYKGRGGIPLDSYWKRLLFAWELSDLNILLSSYIQPVSRIQIWHRVQERVRKVAPFLRLDSDPYIVLSAGRLYWIQDAYTTSSYFPYSEPYQGNFNYIRNSVKVVVDAFDGTVNFYVIDPEDPVLKVYREAFPKLFKELAEMPADLKRHLRYPLDLFAIQIEKYNQYHMTIPQVFYNNEDVWTLPKEKYAGRPITMEPYYILIRMPGEERLEFLLMTPLTPSKRDNMISWLAARCDFPGYGNLIVYKLPKERLIYGPLQIEALIDQDAAISRQLSLWDQRGSRVIRGNLLVIPIDHSFIYVEPVYLIAEENNIPQLRRVIVAYNDRVAMEPTLEEAIVSVFGGPSPKEVAPAPPQPALEQPALKKAMEEVEQAMRRGDWEAFGKAMAELKKLLGQKP